MSNLLSPQLVADCISELVSRNSLWANKNVFIYVIANEKAGCFTRKSRLVKYGKLFSDALNEIKTTPSITNKTETKIFYTEYPNHAYELANAIVTEIIATYKENDENIIVTAGGDGTSLEVQNSLLKTAFSSAQKAEVIKNKITILRLPLGTGNDGTDGHTIDETFSLLKDKIHFSNSRAIKVHYEGKPTNENIAASKKDPSKYSDSMAPSPWYSFNIASIGIDAFVVYMTNKFKKIIPYDFYKMAVPLSGLIYDFNFPAGMAKIQLFDENDNLTKEFNLSFELLAFGISGHRMYGGGHHILPTEDNVCITRKVNLLELLYYNPKFIDGSFKDTKISNLNSANKVKIFYDKPILIQTDGEPNLLCKEHFPLIIEKTSPYIRIIESDSLSYDRGSVISK